MKYKILYAEDEPYLSRIVCDNLMSKGYEVISAADGATALRLYEETKPDLCLIDIMMPAMDGYTLAEQIRRSSFNTPIIFLSAKSLDEDVVRGFKSGGNDYLRKPFSIIELFARMEALLTRFRGSAETSPWFVFGGCRLDTINQQLKTSSTTFDLSHKEAKLLEMLLRKRNDILERHEALVVIWGDDTYYNTNSMNVFITHIRKMLKNEPGIAIINIRGLGYKLTVSESA